MIMPRESFVAEFTPPRAGTFIYHSHSNEYFQINAGLAAPLIVLEPGTRYDSLTDKMVFINQGLDSRGRINGVAEPDTMQLVVGVEYRLRLIDIAPDWRVFVSLADAAGLVRWRAIAKDGADLPPRQRSMQSARIPMGPGETADFVYTPSAPGDLFLDVSTQTDGWRIRVPVRVRSADATPARSSASLTSEEALVVEGGLVLAWAPARARAGRASARTCSNAESLRRCPPAASRSAFSYQRIASRNPSAATPRAEAAAV